MEYVDALQSGSSPKVERAARKISKDKLEGYSAYLISALKAQMDKPRAWKSQSELIKAIGVTECVDALPFLKELVERDYRSTILYSRLAFSILLLEYRSKTDISFIFTAIERGNGLEIAGACSALLYEKIVPSNRDIRKIIAGIAPYIENEGRVMTPRCYIAALAYLWPIEETRQFLEVCLTSQSSVLTEISKSSLQGNAPRFSLV